MKQYSEQERVETVPIASGGSNRAGIGIMVLLAGAIPMLWNLSHFYGVDRATYLLVYFALNFVAFPLGVGAGLLWRGSHPQGHVFLGLAVGAVQAVMAWIVLGVSVDGAYLMLGPEDLVVVVGSILLFIAGARVGDRIENRGVTPHSAADSAVDSPASRPPLFSQFEGWLSLAGGLVILLGNVKNLLS